MEAINTLPVNTIPQTPIITAKTNTEEDLKPNLPEPSQGTSSSKALDLSALLGKADLYLQQTKNIQKAEPAKEFTTMSAQHILLKEEKLALELKQELDNCKTPEEKSAKFAELAQKYSNCPSKEKGGDLGEFGKGQMVPEFEKAASELEVGQISVPIKTDFGWHLIKLNDKK